MPTAAGILSAIRREKHLCEGFCQEAILPLTHLVTPFVPDSSAVPSDVRRLTRSASDQCHGVVLAYTRSRDTTYDFARTRASDQQELLGPRGRPACAGRLECLGRARPRAALRRRGAHPARA